MERDFRACYRTRPEVAFHLSKHWKRGRSFFQSLEKHKLRFPRPWKIQREIFQGLEKAGGLARVGLWLRRFLMLEYTMKTSRILLAVVLLVMIAIAVAMLLHNDNQKRTKGRVAPKPPAVKVAKQARPAATAESARPKPAPA
ncbi:MAG: hypothetical protein NTY53_23750, partial [Kiritimatiellaeota bacterium]|nr:hypothetical protein [Kiritimatiellota bacterium]